MEKLAAKVERLIKEEAAVAPAGTSSTQDLAERLRSALARNAMGVRPDDAKWRAARTAVREARDAWQRIAFVPDDETRALEARFKAACARVMDQVERHVGPAEDGSDGGFGGAGRPDRPGRAGGRASRDKRSTRGVRDGGDGGRGGPGRPLRAK
jgi:hypothetical protein